MFVVKKVEKLHGLWLPTDVVSLSHCSRGHFGWVFDIGGWPTDVVYHYTTSVQELM